MRRRHAHSWSGPGAPGEGSPAHEARPWPEGSAMCRAGRLFDAGARVIIATTATAAEAATTRTLSMRRSRSWTCMVRCSENGNLGGVWLKSRRFPRWSEASGPSSRVLRAASSLWTQSEEPVAARDAPAKTATLTMLVDEREDGVLGARLARHQHAHVERGARPRRRLDAAGAREAHPARHLARGERHEVPAAVGRPCALGVCTGPCELGRVHWAVCIVCIGPCAMAWVAVAHG